jgi:hypothetical protein
VAVNKNYARKRALRMLRLSMTKDKADPEKLAKWFKVMDCKKKIFALEDEINRITSQIHSSTAKK